MPSDGKAPPRRLNGPPVDGGSVVDFRISPDSRTVVYRANQELRTRFQLYAVPIAGGDVVMVGAPRASVQGDFAIAPDSKSVFHRAAPFAVHALDPRLASSTSRMRSSTGPTGCTPSRSTVRPSPRTSPEP